MLIGYDVTFCNLKLTRVHHVPGTFHGMEIVDEDLFVCRQPTGGHPPLLIIPANTNTCQHGHHIIGS